MFKSKQLPSRSLVLILAVSLITASFGVFVAAQDGLFSDVPSDHWAYQDIKYLADRGIIKGLPGGKYEGEEAITRYAVAALVARALRYSQSNQGAISQEDLSTLEDLVFKLSDRVESMQSSEQQFQNRVSNLESQVEQLKAASGPSEDYEKLREQSQNNFVLAASGMALGAVALVWTLFFG